MRALLDINVLIALLDADHVHHSRATAWMANHGHLGWASCALTINGCARIMSNPRYPQSKPLAEVLLRLSIATQMPVHASFACEISVLDPNIFDQSRLLSSAQITDVYLLGLAVFHQARFVTFDSRIVVQAVRSADTANLVVL